MSTIAPHTVGRRTLLHTLVGTLSITPEQHAAVTAAYNDLGSWLKEHADVPWDIVVYTQGSLRINTTNQDPWTGHFDGDIVIRVAVPKDGITQQRLNEMVGGWLGSYVSARQRSGHPLAPQHLSKKKRAWTMEYAGFHIDILPVVPDRTYATDRRDPSWLTDKELVRWQPTDPRGFASWFTSVSEQERLRIIVAKAMGRTVDVENLPSLDVKTVLEQATQLLKRHRDHHFAGAEDGLAPPSIIITTLAGRAYAARTPSGGHLDEVLDQLIPHMSEFVERRQGCCWVANPAYDKENYADRFDGHPERLRALHEWLTTAETDFQLDAGGLDRAAASIDRSFGDDLGTKVAKRLGADVQQTRRDGQLGSTTAGTLAVASGRLLRPNTFFGSTTDATSS